MAVYRILLQLCRGIVIHALISDGKKNPFGKRHVCNANPPYSKPHDNLNYGHKLRLLLSPNWRMSKLCKVCYRRLSFS